MTTSAILDDYLAFCRDCIIDRDPEGVHILTPDSPLTATLPADSPPTALAEQLARCFVLRSPLPLALVEDGCLKICSRAAFEMISYEPPARIDTGLKFGNRTLVRLSRT